MSELISQEAIDSIAEHINARSNKQYSIPVVGNKKNAETPQIFEIIPFDEIDNVDLRFYAIDGSTNSHEFYNGLGIALYRGGYVCYESGKQKRMNGTDDPVIQGKSYTPMNILLTCDDHCLAIYDELFTLEPVKKLMDFFGEPLENIFPFPKEAICRSRSNLLSFCQEILEWSLIYEVANREEIKPGDFILKDGALRSLNIKQEFIVKLGKHLSQEKKVILVAITKMSPIKMELSYSLKSIDDHLQDKLKPKYPFTQKDPARQKLCCWFEVSDSVLIGAYGSDSGGMYFNKSLTGGRGVGLFFAARLDYVEKLQNYDWVIVDVNIFDAIPGIENKDLTRDISRLDEIFKHLTRLTQEHYILGYPYPLVEAHNFVTLSSDLKNEVVNRVKQSLYETQCMDHIDIENMFLDIHTRF